MTPAEPTRTHAPGHTEPPTAAFDPALDAGLAAAFGPDPTPGGWSQPPLLRDDPSENAPLVQPSSPEMPRGVLDRYQLLGEIARGGMGVILKGRDPDLGRDLAVKVLKAELAGKTAAEQRFVEEAQVGGQLQHPGVVPVYDLGRFADGRPYFAMKLVKGRTLAEMLTERVSPSVDRGKFLHVFLQICQTIGYAHSRGVIHRDLKPSNVMVGGFGEVLVMDWGLAKVLPRGGVADEERATQAGRERERSEDGPTVIHTARSGSGAGSDTLAGSVMGTPAFMPPEQAGGEIDKLDERADVFGLGAVLCMILAGQPPYVAVSSDAVRLMAVRGELGDAFARLDGCETDAELVALCKRCLAPKREDRPRHAGEVAAAMTAHLAEVEQRAQRAEVARAAAAAEAGEQHKRRRAQAALGLTFTALVVLGGTFAWWQDRQAAERKAERARVDADHVAERAAADARARQAVESAVALAADLRDRYRFGEAELALDQAAALVPSDAPAETRDRLAAARADLAFVKRLDEIRISRVRSDFMAGIAAVPAAYASAFREYGIDPTDPDTAAIAARVAASPIKRHLVIALDDWSWMDPARKVRERLLAVARRADPGPWSDRLRDPTVRASPATLDRLAAEVDPEAIPAHLLVLLFQIRPRAWPGAEKLLTTAVLRHPDDFWVQFEAGFYYHAKLSRPVAAVEFLQAARTLRPDLPLVLELLGQAQAGASLRDEAVASFREAIRLDPTSFATHLALGRFLANISDRYGALAAFREAVRLAPTNTHARSDLGYGLARTGDIDGAIELWQEVLRTDPNFSPAHYGLAWVLGTGPDGVRDGRRAVEHATRACEQSRWQDGYHIAILAAAYAEAGDFDKAIEYQQLALLFPGFGRVSDEHPRMLRELYRQKKPYRDPVLARREVAPPPREAK